MTLFIPITLQMYQSVASFFYTSALCSDKLELKTNCMKKVVVLKQTKKRYESLNLRNVVNYLKINYLDAFIKLNYYFIEGVQNLFSYSIEGTNRCPQNHPHIEMTRSVSISSRRQTTIVL